MKKVLQPMNLGQIIGRSVTIYIKTLPATLLLVALIGFPIAVLINFYPDTFSISMDAKGDVLVNIINSFLNLVVVPIFYTALAPVTAAGLMGEKPSPVQGLKVMSRSLIPLFLAATMAYVIFIFGTLLLVIPGIIFLLWFLLLPPIVAFEGLSVGMSLSRGRELVRGYMIKELLVICAVSFIYAAASLLIMAGITSITELSDVSIVIIYSAMQALLYPIIANSLILLYIDLRVKKEAFDYETLNYVVQGFPDLTHKSKKYVPGSDGLPKEIAFATKNKGKWWLGNTALALAGLSGAATVYLGVTSKGGGFLLIILAIALIVTGRKLRELAISGDRRS